MPSTAETDAEDVNDFLKRIQELGTKRDQEDEERNRKLEEEILQGRKERQARRAERARSISPTKESPANTPPQYKISASESAEPPSRITLSPTPDFQPASDVLTRNKIIGDAMERLAGEDSPNKENTGSSVASNRDYAETGLERTLSTKASPSSAVPPSRNSPLSWQRRPTSQTSERPRSRPLSMIATENAARSPRATPEPTTADDEHTPVSRDQISQMLGSKDPAWFRQTADRGENSPAYRKNQVEDSNVVEVAFSSRVQLPGMSRQPAKASEKAGGYSEGNDRSTSPSRTGSYASNMGRSLISGSMPMTGGFGSPVPLTSAQRLDPPTNSQSGDEISISGRPLAMSPSQGRISPERGDRPASPTKGMGGFVQSAMMKRSDSVNKRWSVQSPPGLSRGNSIASNRSSADPSNLNKVAGTTRDSRPSSLSRDNSPLPLSRPTSSHSNATVVQGVERPGSSSSIRSSATTSTANDGFIKPSLPASRTHMQSSAHDDENDKTKDLHVEVTPPSSPSKLENRRWSPTKASWLESALNKPESPKPKATPVSIQQPAWMAEIAKAKQRNSAESARSPPVHKHEVAIGGLLRSPPPGALKTPTSIAGFPVGLSSVSSVRKNSVVSNSQEPAVKPKISRFPPSATPTTADKSESTGSEKPLMPNSLVSKTNTVSSPTGKVKPETPPKKDFRANLKPRQLPLENEGKEEPEFKNMFGQLRRTKTQNYVAPDELKDNILRGKAGLNTTGGPKKTERVDEFKEAILKKKGDFEKAQLEGTGVTRSTSGGSQKTPAPLPEALAKKAALGRSGTVAARDKELLKSSEADLKEPEQEDAQMPTLHKETSAPGRMQTKGGVGGKLADRFSPALAGLLARGPPATNDTPRTSSPVMPQHVTSGGTGTKDADTQEAGPQLTHMTKARARGPRRKAPSNLVTSKDGGTETHTEEKDSPPQQFIKPAIKQEKPSIGTGEKFAVFSSPNDVEAENQNAQAASTQKPDVRRRSKFLEEAPNKNEKTYQQLNSPKPVPPTKKPNGVDIAVSKQGQNFPVSERKVTPNTKPKPISLSGSAAVPEPPTNTIKSVIFSPQSTKSPPPVATELEEPVSSVKVKKHQQVEGPADIDSVVSVKSSAGILNRQTSADKSRETVTPVKQPIRLPTQKDEEAAMIGAGLRIPDIGSVGNSKVGPGLQGVELPSPIDERTSNPAMLTPTRRENVASIGLGGGSTKPSTATSPKHAVSFSPRSQPPPTSPKKLVNQAVPQYSEASKLLADFFGKNEFVQKYDVDTAMVLATKPDVAAKIKSLRSQLFQLSGDGKKQQVPAHQERILFENNMYVCTHTFGTLAGKKVVEVYFWAGDGVPESSIEDAELFASREARATGGQLIKLRQGKETSEFIEALGGIMITRRGSSNKYDSLAPHILCGRRYAGQIVFDEVDFSPLSLCSGFPHLISTQSGKSYLWKGKGSGVDELSCARLIGMDFGVTGEIEEIEDGAEPASFLTIFNNDAKILKSADHWRLKPSYQNYSARLFQANASSHAGPQSQIQEIHPFNQGSLLPSQIYVLDAFFEIYVVVGSESQDQYSAFCTALLFAQEYAILAASMEDRPFVPVSTVVLEGVPRDLKFVFRKWRDADAPTIVRASGNAGGLSRGRSLRVVPLSAALDATRF